MRVSYSQTAYRIRFPCADLGVTSEDSKRSPLDVCTSIADGSSFDVVSGKMSGVLLPLVDLLFDHESNAPIECEFAKTESPVGSWNLLF